MNSLHYKILFRSQCFHRRFWLLLQCRLEGTWCGRKIGRGRIADYVERITTRVPHTGRRIGLRSAEQSAPTQLAGGAQHRDRRIDATSMWTRPCGRRRGREVARISQCDHYDVSGRSDLETSGR